MINTKDPVVLESAKKQYKLKIIWVLKNCVIADAALFTSNGVVVDTFRWTVNPIFWATIIQPGLKMFKLI